MLPTWPKAEFTECAFTAIADDQAIPAPPPERVFNAYFTGLPEGMRQMLSIAGWGWHAETELSPVGTGKSTNEMVRRLIPPLQEVDRGGSF
jgi:hypothetical protein